MATQFGGNGFGDVRTRRPAAPVVPAQMNARSQGAAGRSMFSRADTSQQTGHMRQRQTANYTYGASQSGASRERQAQLSSSFTNGFASGVASRRPGETAMQRGSMTRVGGRGRGRAPSKQPMNVAAMSDFIRSQPGGRQFVGESDGRSSGQRNFNQSLSRSGSGMAARGQLPPELQQMAIPFKPNKRAQTSQKRTEEYWKQQAGGRTHAPNKKKGWFNSDRAQFVATMQQNASEQSTEQTKNARDEATVDAVVRSMGKPFVQRRSQAARSQQQQQQQQQQQRQPVGPHPKSAATTVTVRRPPPTVRLVETTTKNNASADEKNVEARKQAGGDAKEKKVSATTVQVATTAFIDAMQRADGNPAPASSPCKNGTCPTPARSLHLKSSPLWDTAPEERALPVDAAAQPSSLFNANISEMQGSVEQSSQASTSGQTQSNSAGIGVEPTTLAVSKTKRTTVQPVVMQAGEAIASAVHDHSEKPVSGYMTTD